MIKLTDIDPNAIYDADDIARDFHVHRTTVHKRIFTQVPTFRLGRKDMTKGEHLINLFSGKSHAA